MQVLEHKIIHNRKVLEHKIIHNRNEIVMTCLTKIYKIWNIKSMNFFAYSLTHFPVQGLAQHLKQKYNNDLICVRNKYLSLNFITSIAEGTLVPFITNSHNAVTKI